MVLISGVNPVAIQGLDLISQIYYLANELKNFEDLASDRENSFGNTTSSNILTNYGRKDSILGKRHKIEIAEDIEERTITIKLVFPLIVNRSGLNTSYFVDPELEPISNLQSSS